MTPSPAVREAERNILSRFESGMDNSAVRVAISHLTTTVRAAVLGDLAGQTDEETLRDATVAALGVLGNGFDKCPRCRNGTAVYTLEDDAGTYEAPCDRCGGTGTERPLPSEWLVATIATILTAPLAARNAQLRQELAEARAKHDEMVETHRIAFGRLERAESEVATLTERLAEAEREREESGRYIEQLFDVRNRWKAKCAAAESEVATLTGRLAEAERERDRNREHYEAERKTNHALTNSITAAEAREVALVEVVKWYADASHYENGVPGHHAGGFANDFTPDSGFRARALLAARRTPR